ncbi:MAG: LacI family transcriptional regulator [Flavobacteriaceae bacterium]|nr:LacI family transcriptional regulator [Flavobacteriaceae bacterium]
MPKVTLKKLAKILGISPATVSKALKNYPDINENTKKRVLELAKSLNYQPNSLAQGLRNNESKIIGLVIPEIVHHFFSNIISGVIKAAEKKGYLIIILQSNESYEQEKSHLKKLMDKNVDGILLSLSDTTTEYKHIKQVIDRGIPIVMYDKISKLISASKVIIDDQKAAFNATQYLIDTGCRKIAHIRGDLKPQTTIDRFIGYKKALAKNNIEFDASLVYNCKGLTFNEGYKIAKKIINDHKDVDGVFAFTDLVATGVLKRFRELDIHVPNQVSVMGFSDWFLTKITTPTLSTVHQPGYEMGQEAFEVLYRDICTLKKGLKIIPEIIEIPTYIVPRNSTKKLPKISK